MTVSAIYENGVFRPTGPVALPEGAAVRFVPEVVPAAEAEAHRLAVYELLSQSFDLGDPELAARHNEHRP